MATYAIGDVHGCFETLQRLLSTLAFDPSRDRLWSVGDLVNRGPASLAVLRWAVDLGDRLTVVLGNHDLHLLALAAGVAERKRRDTLDAILDAPDGDDLLTWLASRPLLHRDGDVVMVHAGLFPAWTVERAERLARKVEERLRGPAPERLLAAAGRRSAERWDDDLSGLGRLQAALAGFTRLRTLTADGRMCADWSGVPAEAPKGCIPWFGAPGRRSAGANLLFGHWAALGLYLQDGLAGLDTGCVWGRQLTALRLDDGALFAEPAVER